MLTHSAVTSSGLLMTIDRLDARLLALIQRDNRYTSDELGQRVGLSATAVQRRLKRLRETGVIESEVAFVRPAAVGHHVAMLVLVMLERERADIIDRFKRAIRETPEIMSGFHVTGEADFALIVTATDMAAYEQFTRDFFYANPDLRVFKTMVIMDRIKAGFAVPIPEHLDGG